MIILQYSDDNSTWSTDIYNPVIPGTLGFTTHKYWRIKGLRFSVQGNAPGNIYYAFKTGLAGNRLEDLNLSDIVNYSGTASNGTSQSSYLSVASRSFMPGPFSYEPDKQEASAGVFFYGLATLSGSGYYNYIFTTPITYSSKYTGSPGGVVTQYVADTWFYIDDLSINFTPKQYDQTIISDWLNTISGQITNQYGQLEYIKTYLNNHLPNIDNNIDKIYKLLVQYMPYCQSIYNSISAIQQALIDDARYTSYYIDEQGFKPSVNNTWHVGMYNNLSLIAEQYGSQYIIAQDARDNSGLSESDAEDGINDIDPGSYGNLATYDTDTFASQGSNAILAWFSASTKNSLDARPNTHTSNNIINFYDDWFCIISDLYEGQ